MSVTDTANTVAAAAQQVQEGLDTSTDAGKAFATLAQAVAQTASAGAQIATGTPTGIALGIVQASSVAASLTPEAQSLWSWLTHLFVHTAKTNPAAVKAVTEAVTAATAAVAPEAPAAEAAS